MATPGRMFQPHRGDIFQRTLLDPDEIRVLVLNPAQGEKDKIYCTLEETRLKDSKWPMDVPNGDGPVSLSYETLSWCWTEDNKEHEDHDEHEINVRPPKQQRYLPFKISGHLNSALQALRYPNDKRYLWIDAICIDQANTLERNAQVPKMDRIYGQCDNVCIWIGMDNEHSRVALKFIREQILQNIWAFDQICANQDYTEEWAAMIRVMSRSWFSRRWVTQEIALAPRGTLHRGADSMRWQDFADAVSLFVYVESVMHRLSDVMKMDPKFSNLPQFFGDVHTLGASLLVDATTNLFRIAQDGKRHPRLSLEHLISKYSLFQASQPRDTIYAFLSIAKDTSPETPLQGLLSTNDPEMKVIQEKLRALPNPHKIYRILTDWARGMSAVQSYIVNYDLPIEEVYKDFIWFSIQKSTRTDSTRALDIICRPWAPRVAPENEHAGLIREVNGEAQFQVASTTSSNKGPPLPSWIPDLDEAAFGMVAHPQEKLGSRMMRRNADPLVGLPSSGERNYSAAGTRSVDLSKISFRAGTAFFRPASRAERGEKLEQTFGRSDAVSTQCQYTPCHCQLQSQDPKNYSMFVEGFVLDEIGQPQGESQFGAIPPRWVNYVNDTTRQGDSPDDLWRTLVADRGPHGQNALTFYPRTWSETFKRFSNDNKNPLNTNDIIDTGGCTIVADFLRRVQAVIWNRQLLRTVKGRSLGLVPDTAREGDLVCILYGCSVPVLLRMRERSGPQMKVEGVDRIRMQKKSAAEFIVRNLAKAYRRRQASRIPPIQPLRRRTTVQMATAGIRQIPEIAMQVRKRTYSAIKTTIYVCQQVPTYIKFLWSFLCIVWISSWAYDIYDQFTGGRAADFLIPTHLRTPVQGQVIRFERHCLLALIHVSGVVPPLTLILPLLSVVLQYFWTSMVRVKKSLLERSGPEKSASDPRHYYTMIGECYVHQMMDGEAISWQNADVDKEERAKRKAVIFELR